MIGRTLEGRYQIVSLLGEGGMGKVYLAEHAALKKRMAVKVLHEEYSFHPEVTKRFQQEAMAASQIGSENIVNVTDFGRTEEGSLYFVMEELRGESLASVIRRDGQIPPGRALPILGQVCRALAAAHARDIIHRDLKPENIMLVQVDDRTDVVKVLDFGISKVTISGQAERITRLGMIVGTPEYMAPEQASGDPVDHRVDIYAAGVVAYEMLTGTLPFTGNNPLQILVKQQAEPVEPLRARRPDLDLPEDLDRVVLRALAKAPEARPASMVEFAAELSLCAERLGLRPIALSLPMGLPVRAVRTGRPTVDLPAAAAAPGAAVEGVPAAGAAPVAPKAPLPRTASIPALPAAPVAGALPESGAPVAASARPSTSILWSRRIGRYAPTVVAIVALVSAGWFFGVRPPAAAQPPVTGAANAAPAQIQPPPPAQARTVQVDRPSGAAPQASITADVKLEPLVPREQPALRTVRIETRPSGATVSLGTTVVGVTPLEVALAEGSEATYAFSREGYKPVNRRIAASENKVKVALERVVIRASSKKSIPKKKSPTSSDGLKDVPF